MNILVSACLLGVRCRYQGTCVPHPKLLALNKQHTLIPVCPEQLGGLPTPRQPSERKGAACVTRTGEEVTQAFQLGAEQALYLARLLNCQQAILKARSPSCGSGWIYDGSFTGRLTAGDGFTAGLLKQHGIDVLTEEDL